MKVELFINAAGPDDEDTKRQDEWDRQNTEDEYHRPSRDDD